MIGQKIYIMVLKLIEKIGGGRVDYINGPDTLPPPLTKDEESQTFAGLESGSESAREKLIVHNLRLVVYIARKFESSGTYASRCIENEILMFLRKSSQYRNEISIDEPLNIDWDGNELLLSDVLGTDEDVVNKGIESEAEKDMLREAVESLNGREKQIMQMRFGLVDGKEKTQKEVADIIGISQSYISRLEKKIIKRLKIEMEKF